MQPLLIGSFTTQPGTATTSPTFVLPPETQSVRLTWRQIQSDFGPNSPTNIQVVDGTILWCNQSISFPPNSNLVRCDLTVPVLSVVSAQISVVVTEAAGTTHLVYVTAIDGLSLTATQIIGSEIVQPVSLARVVNNTAISSFGEVTTAGYGSQDLQTVTYTNATGTISLAQVPGLTWHVNSICVSANQAPGSTTTVKITDGFGTWEQYLPKTGGSIPFQWTFPDGGMSFLMGAGVTITSGNAGAGVTVKLSTASILR